MHERILVPLDGSKFGEAALPNAEDLAIKLAPGTEIEIILLQVISDLTFDVLTADVAAQLPHDEADIRKIKQAVQKYLDKLAEGLRAKGIRTTTVVAEGHAAEEIIKTAKNTNADLIAMSTHGRSGLRRWALGSITDKVLHESEIPVLTVRAKRAKGK
jgi:nucleotide-binding universal stress UspA family protein